MERLINPDPDECPKIRSAFRVARFVGGWSGWFLMRALVLVAVFVGVTTRWHFGLACFLAGFSGLLLVRRFSQCPRCGLSWSAPELESFVCSRCRLNIGLGLRE